MQNNYTYVCVYPCIEKNSETHLAQLKDVIKGAEKRIKIFILKFLMLSFVFFIFIKNGKQNTVCFSFFIFMKELKNELLKQIKINFMINLMINFMIKYGIHVIQKQVRVKYPEIFCCTMFTRTESAL